MSGDPFGGLPPAPMLGHIDREVRTGDLFAAARAVVTVPPWAEGSLAELLWALAADGYPDDVRVLEACLRQRELPSLVARSRRVGTAIGVGVGVCLAPFSGLLALLPAIAVVFVAREVAFGVGSRSLPPAANLEDQRAGRVVADLAFYRSPQLQTTPMSAALLGGLGVLVYVAACLLALNGFGQFKTIVVGAAGALVIAAAALAWLGTRRLVDWGRIGDRRIRPRGPVTSDVLGPVAPLREPLTIRRPRAVAPQVLAMGALGCILVGVAQRAVGLAGLGVALGGVAALVAWRARATLVTIGSDGIVDVRLLRTRRYRWDEVHALLVRDQGGASLVLVQADGRRRELVSGTAGVPTAQLAAIAEQANPLATAPDPGPDPSDGCFLLVAAACLIVATLFVSGLFLGVLLGGGHAAVDPATLPPGTTYWVIPRADGSRAVTIDCPSPWSWAAGERAPLCADVIHTGVVASVVLFVIDVALVVGVVLVLRARRRGRRHRTQAGAG